MLRGTLRRRDQTTPIVGPGGLGSLTKYGMMKPASFKAPEYLKRQFRLESQKHMTQQKGTDDGRRRDYNICTKCGLISVVVNFRRVPSARLGMWGECKGGRDYTHHRLAPMTQAQYVKLQAIPVEQRASYYLFHLRGDTGERSQ